MSYPVETDRYGRAIPPIGAEILYCDLCGDKITPTTIAALLHHLETRHPEEKQAISTFRRIVKIKGPKAEIISVIKCPWGCGFEGPPDEYVKHLETCPAKAPPTSGVERQQIKSKITHLDEVYVFDRDLFHTIDLIVNLAYDLGKIHLFEPRFAEEVMDYLFQIAKFASQNNWTEAKKYSKELKEKVK